MRHVLSNQFQAASSPDGTVAQIGTSMGHITRARTKIISITPLQAKLDDVFQGVVGKEALAASMFRPCMTLRQHLPLADQRPRLQFCDVPTRVGGRQVCAEAHDQRVGDDH